MPNSFRDLTLHDAFTILDCKDVKQLEHTFSGKELDIQQLLDETLPYHKYHAPSPTFSQCILATLTKEPTLPSMMIWSIVGSVTLAVTSLAIVTLATLGMMATAGVVYSIVTYFELKRKQKKINQFFQLGVLKMNCADFIISHYNKEISQSANMNLSAALPDLCLHEYHYDDQRRPKHMMRATGVGVLVATSLLGTYYVGTSAVLLAFGLSTAFALMASPAAIGLGVGAALLAGLYFAYKHFKSLKNKDHLKQLQDELTDEVNSRHRKCHELRVMIPVVRLVGQNQLRRQDRHHHTASESDLMDALNHESLFHHPQMAHPAFIPQPVPKAVAAKPGQ